MSFSVSVLYPNNDDTTFDMDYYLSTHMPLVERGWKPEGLLKWEIVEFNAAQDGTKPAYKVAAYLTFKDGASFAAASKAEASAGIFGDIPNFCNAQPSLLTGKIVAGS